MGAPAAHPAFVVVLWVALLAGTGHVTLGQQGAPSPGATLSPADWRGLGMAGLLAESILRSFGQIFFQDGVLPGALILAGVAVGSRAAAGVAMLGALCGIVTAHALGLDRSLIRQGIYGYNGCLGALAIGSGFLGASRRTVVLGVICASMATVLTAACGAALAPWRLPMLSLPFALSTRTFLLVARSASPRAGPR